MVILNSFTMSFKFPRLHVSKVLVKSPIASSFQVAQLNMRWENLKLEIAEMAAKSAMASARTGMATARTGMATARAGMTTARTGMTTARTGMATAQKGIKRLRKVASKSKKNRCSGVKCHQILRHQLKKNNHATINPAPETLTTVHYDKSTPILYDKPNE